MEFVDIDYNVRYTVYEGNLDWLKGRGGGWCVMGMPPEYDGSNDDVLQPYLINQNLVDMIEATEQPSENNITMIRKEESDNELDS